MDLLSAINNYLHRFDKEEKNLSDFLYGYPQAII